MIRIEHLRKEYPNVMPLKDVSVEIHDGDVISVIGPSGTGKSTLLRCINQLEKPTSGRIWLDDVEITNPRCDITKVRRKMGMVFQGDEFVILTRDIDQDTFERKAARLGSDAKKNGISIAIGSYWSDGNVDMKTAFKNADEMMYADKAAYYERHPELKRHS